MLHRGRLSRKKLEIGEIRALRPDDLLRLREKRTTPVVQRLRDPHHRLARMIAMGTRLQDAAEQCGFSISRVYVLHTDPSFQDLVASYRKDVSESFRESADGYHREVVALNRKALRHVTEAFDKADEEGEIVPLSRALSVFIDTSDRVGINKKSTVTNINIDFAARLEAARQRSDKAKVIEGCVVEPKRIRRI